MLLTTNIVKLAEQRKRVIDAVNNLFVIKCENSIDNLEKQNISSVMSMEVLEKSVVTNNSQIELTKKLMKEV